MNSSDLLNAGYYNPAQTGAGTDFSLGAPLACTDLAIDATTATKVSSAQIGLTSAHVGSGLRITAGTGFTAAAPPYEILSVSAGVATLDRSAGTTGSTGGTARLGGPLATPGQMAAFVSIGGMTAFLKSWASSYNLSATANVAGGRLNPGNALILIGYDTTRTIGNSDANRPTLNCNAASMTGVIPASAGSPGLHNLILDNSGGNASVTLGSLGTGPAVIRRVVFRRSTVNGLSLTGNSHRISDCEWDSCSGTGGLNSSAARLFVERCTLHDLTTTNAVVVGSADAMFADTLVANFNGTGNCFSLSGSGQIWKFTRCTGHNKTVNSAAAVFNINSGHADFSYCLAAGAQGGASAYGFLNNAGASDCRIFNCFSYNNASGASSGFAAYQINGLTTLTSDPFVNAVAGNFALNTTAGGGAATRGIAYSFPGLSTTSYPDAGAVQHPDPTGGGAVSIGSGG